VFFRVIVFLDSYFSQRFQLYPSVGPLRHEQDVNRSWHILGIIQEVARTDYDNHKKHDKGTQSPGRDSNPGLPNRKQDFQPLGRDCYRSIQPRILRILFQGNEVATNLKTMQPLKPQACKSFSDRPVK
jgi:hypothetical protein